MTPKPVTPVTAAELGEAIANFLSDRFESRPEIAVVGPIDDGETVVVLQPRAEHRMITIHNCELVIR